MQTDPKTLAWRYYEQGRAYNQSLSPSLYTAVNTNIAFFTGNQWLGLPQTRAMAALPKPVFNIIKRVTSLFVASLTASAVSLRYEPLRFYDGENLSDPETDASAYATAEVQNLFEKFKMDSRIREALFDGAQTGDYCAHFYWEPDAMPYGGAFGAYRGEIRMELIDGVNVMFGNPNCNEVEKQGLKTRERFEDIKLKDNYKTIFNDYLYFNRYDLNSNDNKSIYINIHESMYKQNNDNNEFMENNINENYMSSRFLHYRDKSITKFKNLNKSKSDKNFSISNTLHGRSASAANINILGPNQAFWEASIYAKFRKNIKNYYK